MFSISLSLYLSSSWSDYVSIDRFKRITIASQHLRGGQQPDPRLFLVIFVSLASGAPSLKTRCGRPSSSVPIATRDPDQDPMRCGVVINDLPLQTLGRRAVSLVVPWCCSARFQMAAELVLFRLSYQCVTAWLKVCFRFCPWLDKALSKISLDSPVISIDD